MNATAGEDLRRGQLVEMRANGCAYASARGSHVAESDAVRGEPVQVTPVEPGGREYSPSSVVRDGIERRLGRGRGGRI